MKDKKWKIAYHFKFDRVGYTHQQLVEMDRGGCDAAIMVSLCNQEDRSVAYAIMSLNGDTGELCTEVEMFHAMNALAWEIMNRAEPGSIMERACKRFMESQSMQTIQAPKGAF